MTSRRRRHVGQHLDSGLSQPRGCAHRGIKVTPTERSPRVSPSRVFCSFCALHSRSRDRMAIRSRLRLAYRTRSGVVLAVPTVARIKKRLSVGKAGITVVPVLRPVTDCRPYERLGLSTRRGYSVVGKHPGLYGPRAKKGSGPRGGVPPESVTAPSPPTSRAWFPRLRFSPFSATREPPLPSRPPRRVPSLPCTVSVPPLRSFLSVALAIPSATPDNSAVKCARSLCSLEGDTHGDFGPSRRIEARRGSRFGPFLLAHPHPLASPFAAYVTRSRIVSRARELVV